MKTSIKNKL